MAVTLHEKFAPMIEKQFTIESYFKGASSNRYEFTGNKSIKLTTIETVDPVPFTRSGSGRFGTVHDVEDTIQNLTIVPDYCWAVNIDKGDNIQSGNLRKTGEFIAMQRAEKDIPFMDKYVATKLVKDAGIITTINAAPAKNTIVAALISMKTAMVNRGVSCTTANTKYYITATVFEALVQAPEFQYNVIAEKALSKGVLGTFFGFPVVVVADEYLPTDCYALLLHKDAWLYPHQLADVAVIEKAVGYRGPVIQSSFIFDCFVIGTKAAGVVALVKAASKQAAVTISDPLVGVVTLTSTGANSIKYTLDGTDPRYSVTAITTTTGGTVTVTEVTTIKAVAYDDTLFTSDVATKEVDPT